MNQTSSKRTQSQPGPVTLDCDHLFTHAGGDPELVLKLCARFLSEVAPCVDAIRSAIVQCKHPAADRAAQQLRTCLMIFGAGQASTTAEALDIAIRCGRARDAQREWAILERELQLLLPQVQQLLLQLSTPKTAVQ